MNNVDFIKQYHTKIWHEKDINAIDEHFAQDAMIESPIKSSQGLEEMKTLITQWHQGFPNLTVFWDEYITEGNKVVARWHCTGVQEGPFLGKPASNNTVNYSGVTIYQINDAKITHYWSMIDMDTLKSQL